MVAWGMESLCKKIARYWERAAIAAAFALLCCAAVNPASAQETFVHPGVLVSRKQLDFVKGQVANQIEPIYSAFLKAQNSTYGSLTYTPQGPPADGVVNCGSYSNPNVGCSAENADASAAYTQALLFWITGNRTYAQNAITILNTYRHNLKSYTNSNAPLQAAWGSSKWARAAEIIRYSHAGWPKPDAEAFGAMMNKVMLPQIINGYGGNGNWELSMIEGMIGLAVYNDDTNLFNHAIAFWRQRVPAYFYYFPIDGPHPVQPPRGSLNWHGQSVYDASVNGIAQETCRDFGHTEYGIAATMSAAETAHIQGVDLFGSERPRLEAAMEFHTFYLLGNPVPDSVCGGKVTLARYPTFEVGYNNFHNRLRDSLPNTLNWLETDVRTRPVPVDAHMMVFEPLTDGADAGFFPSCITAESRAPWQDSPLPSNQTGTFTVEYDATPSASSIDAVVGLSDGVQTAYTGFAVLTRFNPSGTIDARDGDAYTAELPIPYQGHETYHFRVVVDTAAHTYSAYVILPSGAQMRIGDNLVFRTEQRAVSQLNWWGGFTQAGSQTICNFSVH